MDTNRYEAWINTPGYLPHDDEPSIFDTPAEAWEWLAERRTHHAEQVEDYDDDAAERLREQRTPHAVYVGTPGYHGEHDLGLVYTVSVHVCPGMECPDYWHVHGCAPYWQYIDAAGCEISGSPTAERDAVERRLWRGPDGPDVCQRRDTATDEWVTSCPDGCSWVAGMMVVNPEDLDTISAVRTVQCERCDAIYGEKG